VSRPGQIGGVKRPHAGAAHDVELEARRQLGVDFFEQVGEYARLVRATGAARAEHERNA
jgi:hypothetical protein